MSLEGRMIEGKYRVGRRVGGGGMGDVYEAVHEGTERTVAIKFLHPEYATHPEAVVRFNREARAAGRIGHDNICEVTDVGRMESGAPYLVMPLLRGQALSDAMREAGPLPVVRCVDVVSQMLSALAAAHAAGIVHRDLKPDNVYLVQMGDREDFVKLLDFGIAKMVRDHITDAKLTQTGTVMGTPFYMSPEQARGLTNLDHRVDLYATGVILYEMLTTRTPFLGDTYNQILSAILLDPFPPPRTLRADIPLEVEEVVMRAMARDRDQRYQDAAAMRSALLAAVRHGTTGERPVLAPAANPQPMPAMRVPTAAPFSMSPVTSSGMTLTPMTAAMDVTARGKRRSRMVAAAVLGVVLIAAVGLVLALRGGRTTGADKSSGAPPVEVETSELAASPPLPTGEPPRLGAEPLALQLPQSRPQADGAGSGVDAGLGDRPDVDPRGGDAPVAAQPSTDNGTDAASALALVRIELTGVPAGAGIRVDGRSVPSATFDVAQGDRDVLVEVTAAGYVPWRRRIPASAAAAIEVQLRRSSSAAAGTTTRPPTGGHAGRPTKTLHSFGEGP